MTAWALRVSLLFFLTLPMPAGQAAADPLKAIYGTRMGGDARNDYPIKLLELALEKSGRDFILAPYDVPITQSRALLALESGQGVSVHFAGTSREFETRFLPIRIPIYRGLLGYRIFIINPASQPLFSRIQSLDELAGLRAGQGNGWSDIEILENSGLIVMAAPYESLLKMIELNRIDYFPRGINEAYPEVDQYLKTYPRLAVEEDLLLVYPFALFFFVNKGNQALHDAIEDGLVNAYGDGSFMALFNSHPHLQKMLKRVRLERRRRFDIENPLMTAETAAIPDRYWYQPMH